MYRNSVQKLRDQGTTPTPPPTATAAGMMIWSVPEKLKNTSAAHDNSAPPDRDGVVDYHRADPFALIFPEDRVAHRTRGIHREVRLEDTTAAADRTFPRQGAPYQDQSRQPCTSPRVAVDRVELLPADTDDQVRANQGEDADGKEGRHYRHRDFLIGVHVCEDLAQGLCRDSGASRPRRLASLRCKPLSKVARSR